MWIAGFSLARGGGGIWLDKCLIVWMKSESSKRGEQQGMDLAEDWLWDTGLFNSQVQIQ